jgi:hypothetical protein
MSYANFAKIEMKFFIFCSPIGLNGNNFLVKAPLKKLLKFMELFKHLRFVTQGIKPNKFAMITDEAHIIFVPPNRVRSCPIHQRKLATLLYCKFAWK